jgi:hypothetical protein
MNGQGKDYRKIKWKYGAFIWDRSNLPLFFPFVVPGRAVCESDVSEGDSLRSGMITGLDCFLLVSEQDRERDICLVWEGLRRELRDMCASVVLCFFSLRWWSRRASLYTRHWGIRMVFSVTSDLSLSGGSNVGRSSGVFAIPGGWGVCSLGCSNDSLRAAKSRGMGLIPDFRPWFQELFPCFKERDTVLDPEFLDRLLGCRPDTIYRRMHDFRYS